MSTRWSSHVRCCYYETLFCSTSIVMETNNNGNIYCTCSDSHRKNFIIFICTDEQWDKLGCLFVWWCLSPVISVISWRSVLLVEETGGPRENQRPFASHWQTLPHNTIHLALIEIRTHNISGDGTDCIDSCKSNYNTITATTAPPTECDIPVFYNLMKIYVRLVPSDNSRTNNWRYRRVN